MKSYYDDGLCTIYHGDCAEIAPTLGRFDLLCTDPPYGIGEARRAGGSRRAKRVVGGLNARRPNPFIVPVRDYGVADWDDAPAEQDLIDSVRSTATWHCVFGGNFYQLPPSPAWLVWDKLTDGTSFADCELAWTNYGCAIRRLVHQWSGMLRGGVAGKSAEPRYHPTQKPLAVMSWAIGLCPERPTSVLDPFMGSGTTLRACKDLGIKCTGIDREEKYCEIAARRLGQGVLNLGGLP